MLLTEDRVKRVTIAAQWDGTGTAPAGSVIEINSPGSSSVAVQVTGAMTATLVFEGLIDEATPGAWFAVNAAPIPSGAVVTSATAAGKWLIPNAGLARIRVRCSSYVSGSPVVCLRAALGASPQLAAVATVASLAIADGSDVAEGTTTDAAIVSDSNGTVIGFLRGIVKILADIWNSTLHAVRIEGIQAPGAAITEKPVLIAGENGGNVKLVHVTSVGDFIVGGIDTVISTTLTRPADTTLYTAGDEITDIGGAIQTLTGIARFSSGSGVIMGAGLSISSVGSPLPALELWIFDTTSTPQTDNAAFAPADSVVNTALAVIPLTATYVGTTGASGNVWMDTGPINVPFLCVGSANLYLRVVVRNAYQAGANSDTYKFRFRVSQD